LKKKKIIYMVKLLSAIGFLAGVCLVGSCTKMQNYGGTAVAKMANGWWVMAYSSKNGLIVITPPTPTDTASNHIFFVTYNASQNTTDSLWADDLEGIGGPYDVKALLGVNLSNYTVSSSGTANLYQPGSSVQWASGTIFPKGGVSRTGEVTDSIHLQFLFTGDPGDTLTIQGVARTGFDGDDWPISPYTPTP
jgi:Lipid-binding putative hydrolase